MPGLYIHIPFCEKKCHYCNFVITTDNGSLSEEVFLSSLEREIHKRSSFFRNKPFKTIYAGGGTPSHLSLKTIEKIFNLLHQNFLFMPDLEITWEANPNDLNEEKVGAYKKLGINRISLGAQSFNDKLLSFMNRTHKAEMIDHSFEILHEAGIRNINLDLMLALPHQHMEDMRKSLEKIKILKPTHISLYELVIENKTVFQNWNEKGKLPLPDEDEALRFLEEMRLGLGRLGFVHYELLNYAKPGFESKHNELYWMNQEYLGLGPGAFSYFNGKRFQYAASVDEYYTKIKEDVWHNQEEETLTGEKKIKESFVLRLRLLQKGVNLRDFPALTTEYKSKIEVLKENGFLYQEKGIIRLSSKGKLFAESVFCELS